MKILVAFIFIAFVSVSLHAAVPGGAMLAGLISDEFDTNSDALIDAGEWQTGIGESFGKLDANSDGSIAPAELDGLSADISPKTGDFAAVLVIGLIKQPITALDKDGDKLVSQKEYDQLSLDLFAKLDVDKNNSLTKVELAELPVKLLMK